MLFAVALVALLAAGPEETGAPSSSVRTYALRLKPGQDVRQELLRFARANGLRAAAVLSAAGSVTRATVRYADRPQGTALSGHFEVTSLSGTLTRDGAHLHVALADGDGVTRGGHLLDGSAVYTTLEVVIGELADVDFVREKDAATGYDELVVKPRR